MCVLRGASLNGKIRKYGRRVFPPQSWGDVQNPSATAWSVAVASFPPANRPGGVVGVVLVVQLIDRGFRFEAWQIGVTGVIASQSRRKKTSCVFKQEARSYSLALSFATIKNQL